VWMDTRLEGFFVCVDGLCVFRTFIGKWSGERKG
jgi:hypothetical protein